MAEQRDKSRPPAWDVLAHAQWHRLIAPLFSIPRRTTLLLCTMLFTGFGALDYVTPPVLNLTFLYVLVVLLATWNAGARAGLAFAVAAALMQAWMISRFPAELGAFYPAIILANRTLTFLLVVALTGPLRTLYDRERAHASTDALTGAANRKAFEEALRREAERSRRSGEPFSVAFLDCDDFKAVNDRHGHRQGDELLRSVVRCAGGALRGTDLIARIGGDEFAILFPRAEGPEAMRALERLRADLQRAFAASGWEASLSMGAATFRRPDKDADAILSVCDALMYRAKTQGKNQLVYENAPVTPA